MPAFPHRHLLGIDRVVVDPGAGVGLVVASTLERGLLVAHLDLEVCEVRDVRDADPTRRQAADLCSPQVVIAGHGDGVGGPGHRFSIHFSPKKGSRPSSIPRSTVHDSSRG